MRRGKQVGEELWVEENIRIHHHESVAKEMACQPERVHTVGLTKDGIFDVLDFAAAGTANVCGLKSNHHRNLGYSISPKVAELALN